jgi:AcrR family transcriptional regulator
MSDSLRLRGRPATFDRASALDAAVTLFWRHGYDGASISMLSKAMGVTAPTLYAAFGSKEALYREALARYQTRQVQGEAPAQQGKVTLYDRVSTSLRSSAAAFASSLQGRGCMVQIGALQSSPEGQPAAEATAAARCNALTRFIAAFDAAKEQGEVPATTDSAAMSRYYLAVIQGMAVQATDGASADELNRVVELALASWPGGRSS